MRSLFQVLVLAAFWGGATAAPPDALSPADEVAVRAVVQAQLDAFAADDAERAFSYAAPEIRERFGDAARFMAMVRGGYPAIYRPAAVDFLAPEVLGGEVVQAVRLTDRDGRLWVAIYRLKRQDDGHWRIGAVQLAGRPGRST